MANFATKSLVSVLSSLVLIVSTDGTDCEWKFLTCHNIGEIWQMKCEVLLTRFNPNGTTCGDVTRKSYMSWRSHRFRNFCRIAPKCSIVPAWCSWGPWEPTYSNCELQRTRKKCCHPVTLKKDKKITCSSYGRKDRKTIPGCTKEKEDEAADTREFKIFIRDCILITISCIFVLVTCTVGCRIYCRYSVRRRSRPPDLTGPPAYPQPQVQRPLVPSAVYHHDGDLRVALPSYKLHSAVTGPPPSYDEAMKVTT